MGYTSWEIVRELNKERLGIDAPKTVRLTDSIDEPCIKFIYEMCEGLGFDFENENRIKLNDFDGASVKTCMIPFNMEKDIDRLCLENAVRRFLKSGLEEDAFDIYFCYIEMFLGNYSEVREYRKCVTNKYSHAVNIFIRGLGRYYSDEILRKSYKECMELSDDRMAAHSFLRLWGMASLFDDTQCKSVLQRLLDEELKECMGEVKVGLGLDCDYLFNFAVMLNARYNYECYENENEYDRKRLEEDYNKLSLEYKISNICQAKAFIGYLDDIGCFYTSEPVDKEPIWEFSRSDMDIIGPLEHDRWMNEKISMGWTSGNQHRNKQERELTRTSDLLIPYNDLTGYEQDKDMKPMICMMKLIKKYSIFKVYRK